MDENLSTLEIAEVTGMSTSGVTSALERAGIDRRTLGGPQLEIDDATLETLYVDQRIDERELAARFDVAPWAVRRRLREAGIRRPNGTPPGGLGAMLPKRELRRLYVKREMTSAALAAHFKVPDPTVRRWLELAGIPLRPRPEGAGARPGEAPTMSRDELWRRYVDEQQTAAEIAQDLDVTKNVITTSLHALRIPVRSPGPSEREPVVLLDALYSDQRILKVLDRHDIPRRPEAGFLRERWPTPIEPSEAVLTDLYLDIGLSTSRISLLTGIEPAGIRHRPQRAGISARAGSRSPWRADRTKAD